MGLKVWLPLNGNIENKGASNCIFTYSSPSYVDGKIGKCLYIDNKVSNTQTFSLRNNRVISICFWVKVPSSATITNWADIVGVGCMKSGSSSTLRLEKNSSGGFVWFANNVFSGDGGCGAVNGLAQDNVWHHVALTCDGVKMYHYIDGAYKSTYTIPSTYDASYFTGSFYFGNAGMYCYLNDVRIYDHCLSAAEVHEISQGLVLHYKLDGFGKGNFGNPNLANGTNTPSIETNAWNFIIGNGDITKTIEYENEIPLLVFTRGTSGSAACYLTYNNLQLNQIKPSTTYTISFDISSSQMGTIELIGIMQNDSTNSLTESTITIQGQVSAGQIWTHIILQCTTKSSFSGITIGNQVIYMSLTRLLYQIRNVIKLKNIKVEEGTANTPWCLSDSELTIDRTIISDNSGYGYNGVIHGTPILNASEGRYKAHISFTANNQYIQCNSLTTSGFSNSYTFSWWGKKSAAGTMFWGFQNGIRLNGLYNNNLWNTGDGSSNPLYQIGTTTTYSIDASQYHHYVMTGNGTKCYLYVDGVRVAEAKTYKSISGTNLFINGWDSGTNYSGIMSISDFRIYCTTLSDEDIQQLAEVGARVDNKGNWHTYALDESSLVAMVHKTGIVSAREINENLNFEEKGQIILNTSSKILFQSDFQVITTKDGHTITGSIPTLDLTTISGREIRFSYEVSCPGTRYSEESGSSNIEDSTYGIDAIFLKEKTDGSGTQGAHYDTTNLVYSGDGKRQVRKMDISNPGSGWKFTQGTFNLHINDKPASTNNNTWFIRNVRAVLIPTTTIRTCDINGTHLIEF